MIIVVNDANILIDVIKLDLVNEFFALPFKFHTTQLIIDEELYDEQLEQLQPHIDEGELEVRSFTAHEMTKIATINQEKPQLSNKDCSAFFCADDLDAVLLTSDNNLRRFAQQKNVEVHGHLWLFDQLVDCGCIQARQAASKLDELDIINPRLKLPIDECDKRKRKWITRRR